MDNKVAEEPCARTRFACIKDYIQFNSNKGKSVLFIILLCLLCESTQCNKMEHI